MQAMRIVRIHGSRPGSQFAANRLELNGQKSAMPLDWHASMTMCSKAAHRGSKNVPKISIRRERTSMETELLFGASVSIPNPALKIFAMKIAGDTAEIRTAVRIE